MYLKLRMLTDVMILNLLLLNRLHRLLLQEIKTTMQNVKVLQQETEHLQFQETLQLETIHLH
ncbi:hypothetical protein D3C84_540180 [compost metagenome]